MGKPKLAEVEGGGGGGGGGYPHPPRMRLTEYFCSGNDVDGYTTAFNLKMKYINSSRQKTSQFHVQIVHKNINFRVVCYGTEFC